jgi:hypothetical protein
MQPSVVSITTDSQDYLLMLLLAPTPPSYNSIATQWKELTCMMNSQFAKKEQSTIGKMISLMQLALL